MRSRIRLVIYPALLISLIACNKNGKSKGTPDNGQLMGVAPSAKPSADRPVGMVYVPPGTFHMGPSDEDVNFNFTARNKQVSINGFWMDATEITNNEYRQFVNWVKDSIFSPSKRTASSKKISFKLTIESGFSIVLTCPIRSTLA